jgi:hypothetical protein
VLRDDKASVLDLFSADYTFANERLARHYGIPSVRGAQFPQSASRRRAALGPVRQGQRPHGLLVPGPHLARAAGAWIMDQIVGAPPQPPPPGVETNLPQLDTGVALSVRDRLARHRTKPSCNQCTA